MHTHTTVNQKDIAVYFFLKNVHAFYTGFYELGLNLGIAILRSDDIPRFILRLSHRVLIINIL